MYTEKVEAAEGKELSSRLTHKSFRTRKINDVKAKLLSSRWVLSRKVVTAASKAMVSEDVGKTWSEEALEESNWSGRQWEVKAPQSQKTSVDTYSPTTSRTGQRLLTSTSVRHWLILERFDISTAFLQGRELGSAATKSGDERVAGMRPPLDCWDLLRELQEKYGEEIPARKEELS